ncbi:MAG: hypothetical protein JETT_1961 [Candidatus Jettenia ecosi]|uniref:Uncharacterized protein n=1 Tax=Candidatus Jettenia ecosi TaxID=2494326 RepID=A0A533QAQ6_9BACT|nr:MAG: hypothetical protein JETT_1961 [Candidatus Jettenia ecosi]
MGTSYSIIGPKGWKSIARGEGSLDTKILSLMHMGVSALCSPWL